MPLRIALVSSALLPSSFLASLLPSLPALLNTSILDMTQINGPLTCTTISFLHSYMRIMWLQIWSQTHGDQCDSSVDFSSTTISWLKPCFGKRFLPKRPGWDMDQTAPDWVRTTYKANIQGPHQYHHQGRCALWDGGFKLRFGRDATSARSCEHEICRRLVSRRIMYARCSIFRTKNSK